MWEVLVNYIKNTEASSKEGNMSGEDMLELAQFYLEKNQPNKSDYVRKYEEMVEAVDADNSEDTNLNVATKEDIKSIMTESTIKKEEENVALNDDVRNELIKRLKSFRVEQSRKENVKPYFIFNDAQMNDLIDKQPKTKEELLKVSGFGNVKVEKYGDTILMILKEEFNNVSKM